MAAMPTNQNITIKYLAPGRNGSPASPIRLGVLEGMHQQLDPMGFSSAVDFFNNPEQHEAAIRRLPDTSSAAAIWNEPYISNDVFDYLKKRKFPFVLLDSYPKDIELDYVVGDNTSGGRMMVEHLVSLGHSKIVYITAATSRTSLRDRKAGFIQGAVEAGIEISNKSIYTLSCQNAEDGKESIPGVLKEILARPDKPTAICLSNDILALTAIQWLGEQGIKVPTDLSIVGYDNIDLGEYSTVPLTTVGQHWMELGRSAADVLYQKLQNPKMRRHLQIMVKPTFVVRKSAAKPSR
jgi:DNA-binding LacI/PurR family transcriptional regulator